MDLAPRPGYANLLGFLPPDRYRALLEAAGFGHAVDEHSPQTGTTDPILQSWTRLSRPDHDGPDQQQALEACLAAATLDSVAHKTRPHDWTVETQRSLFLILQERKNTRDDKPNPALVGLSHLWRGYVEHGRHRLIELGERVLPSLELAPGFAVADLIVGRTLVEIKTSSHPHRDMDLWLNQVLAYLLVDRHNVLYLKQIALYLGWQALLLVTPVDDLLRSASAGPTPTLTDLRVAFAEALGEDIDNGAHWQRSQHYPVPPEAIQQ